MPSTWRIYFLAVVSFLVGTSEYIISGVLDKIAVTMEISISAAGQLITVFSLVYAVGTPILMALTTSIERQKLLIYSLGIFVLANILSYALPGIGLFVAARIIMALSAGMVVVTALGIAARISPAGKQASSIAIIIMGFTASLIIGVPLGRIAAAAFGWKSVFGLIAILGILAMIVLFLAIPRSKGDVPIPLRKQVALLKNTKIALGLSITFFWLGGYSVAYTYISPYLLTVTGLNERMLSAALLAFGLASLIGSKFGGYSTDKWGVPSTLIGGMLLHLAALIALSFTTAAENFIPIFAILMAWSFACWSSGPAHQYNMIRLKPESSGVILGFNQSMMQLSMSAGAAIGGAAAQYVSLSSVTWVGSIGIVAAIACSLMLFRSDMREKAGGSTLQLQD
ncbi:MFS transporter [Paenibacillus sp. sptzw28]|uniref:MFS transporter n=1 Tax=Paenibacillus sp. sptzw28 TaxID=715179 RepID=UPI001C6EB0C4|nr:MFS transporter [Paenibacillus sp. sptzw28]QYR23158.1 MFS transporter [Paenibacillus sp. sptzw28]